MLANLEQSNPWVRYRGTVSLASQLSGAPSGAVLGCNNTNEHALRCDLTILHSCIAGKKCTATVNQTSPAKWTFIPQSDLKYRNVPANPCRWEMNVQARFADYLGHRFSTVPAFSFLIKNILTRLWNHAGLPGRSPLRYVLNFTQNASAFNLSQFLFTFVCTHCMLFSFLLY